MSHLNKKALGTGVAVVALSAFVPNPFMMGQALAQATDTDTMNVNASVVNPLVVSEQTKLAFGAFAVTANAGTFTFNGTKTSISNGVVVTTGTLGKVQFSAPQNATFTISIPDFASAADVITLTNGGGGASSKTMKLTQLTLDATTKLSLNGATGAADVFNTAKKTEQAKVTDAGGVGIATVGGTLTFTPNQVTGLYTATYTMSITF